MLASDRASTAQREPGLRDTDPTGAQIRMYPGPIPSGDLRKHTEIRGVLAFADPYPRYIGGVLAKPGHWGACYQAAGCVAIGRSTARVLTLLPDGSVLSDRSRAKLLAADQGWRYVRDRLVDLGATPPTSITCPSREWLTRALVEVGATRLRHGGNYRYAWPLARGVRIGMAPEPYPKPLADNRIPTSETAVS